MGKSSSSSSQNPKKRHVSLRKAPKKRKRFNINSSSHAYNSVYLGDFNFDDNNEHDGRKRRKMENEKSKEELVYDDIIKKSKKYRNERKQKNVRIRKDIKSLNERLDRVSGELKYSGGKRVKQFDDYDKLMENMKTMKIVRAQRKVDVFENVNEQKKFLERMEKRRLKRMDPYYEINDEDNPDKLDDQYLRYAEEEENIDIEYVSNKKKNKRVNVFQSMLGDELLDDDENNNSIPYVITMPKNMRELKELIAGKNLKDTNTIFIRLETLNYFKLGQTETRNIQKFFTLLLDLFLLSSSDADLLNLLSTHLQLINQQITQFSSKIIYQKLEKLYSKTISKFPQINELAFIKLVSALYPMSDKTHYIGQPLTIFINKILSNCVIGNDYDISAGLFICHLCLESFRDSKRFSPEVVNFLYFLSNCAYFKNISEEELDKIDISNIDFLELLQSPNNIKSKRISLLLLDQFIDLYSKNISFPEIFQPFLSVLSDENLIKKINECSQEIINERKPLEYKKQRVAVIDELLPDFDDDYTGKLIKIPQRSFKKKKLKKKGERIRKQAIREIKKGQAMKSREINAKYQRNKHEQKQNYKRIMKMLQGDYEESHTTTTQNIQLKRIQERKKRIKAKRNLLN